MTSARRVRVAYVNPTRMTKPLAAQIDLWWSTSITMERLVAAGDLDIRVFMRAAVGARDETLARGGVTYTSVADAYRRGGVGDRFAVRLARAVRGWRPEVVHLNGWLMPSQSWWLCRRLRAATRIVVQHHGESPAVSARSRRFQRAVARRIDGALFTGAAHGMSEEWVTAGLFPPDLTCYDVVETAVALTPVARDRARHALGVRADPMVLWVGRLMTGKDPLTALSALRCLRTTHPGAAMWMVFGGGDLLAEVMAAIDHLGLTDAVHLVRSVPHAFMPQWYGAADVLLSTSRREGSGYAVIEALSVGCKVAVSDIPAHRGLVVDVDDVVFSPGDPESAAAAMTKALGLSAPVLPDVVAQLRIAYGLAYGLSGA